LENNNQIDPALNAKVKKNLLWVSIFSIIMIFAGLTSAYIVSQGSEFWVHFKMPLALNISTVLIILSSVALFIARIFIRKNSFGLVKIFLGLALIGGIMFGYYQFKGWQNLYERGFTVTSPIINQNGKYGQFYELTYQGKEISFDNEEFYWSGQPLSQELSDKMMSFCKQLETGSSRKNKSGEFQLDNYGTDFVLKYESQPISFLNKKMQFNGQDLNPMQLDRLNKFSECMVNGRGDFMMTGKYGKDFTIYYKGEVLEYKNRTFYLKGKKLTAKQDNDLQGSRNKSSSFIYVFTGIHLAHWIGGIIALFVIFIRSLRLKYSNENYLGIQLGSTYWHFLGILWIYLYAFLIFIH